MMLEVKRLSDYVQSESNAKDYLPNESYGRHSFTSPTNHGISLYNAIFCANLHGRHDGVKSQHCEGSGWWGGGEVGFTHAL